MSSQPPVVSNSTRYEQSCTSQMCVQVNGGGKENNEQFAYDFPKLIPNKAPSEPIPVVSCKSECQISSVMTNGSSSDDNVQQRWRNNNHDLDGLKPIENQIASDSDDSSLSSNASSTQNNGMYMERRKWNGNVRWVHNRNSSSGNRQYNTMQRHNNINNNRQMKIAPDRYLAASYPFHIKYTPQDLMNGSKWDPLSKEMWDKFVSSQQTEETFRKKMSLWRFLYISIKSIFPRYGLYLVGSTMSGFGLDSSDMDLCLYVRALDCVDSRSHALLHLGFILSYIRSFDSVLCNAELIQAKVPILKFRDSRHGIEVDLNCNNIVGIRNTNLLYCYSQMDWRVRPLVLIVKLWAQAQDINDARTKTVSSYSLALMVLHFLQCGVQPAILPCLGARDDSRPPPSRPPTNNKMALGELMLGFLYYYATFPYEKYAISVRTGSCVPIEECRMARSYKNDPHQWKLLCVEEPFDLTNTARSVYDPEVFDKIIHVFRKSHKTLLETNRLEDIMVPR